MQKNLYDLTSPQKSIWFTQKVFNNLPIANICGSVIISDKVNFNLLQQAINILVERNCNYRLRLTSENNKIMQYVEPYSKFDIEIINLHSQKQLEEIEQKTVSSVFDVLNSRLFEFKLFRFDDGHGGYIYNAHHLISDAWTSGITASEIMDIYSKLLKDENIDDITYPSYIDYINSEQEYINSDRFFKDKNFWDKQFDAIPEVATIPTHSLSKAVQSCASRRKQFSIQNELVTKITNLCKDSKVSMFNFLMAIYSTYIHKTTNLDEFVIGTPILNRSNIKEKHTCGMFINTVPVKISLSDNIKFIDFASSLSGNLFNIFKHQKYQYLSILEDLRKKDSSIPNLYNILISYQNIRSTAHTSEIPYNIKWIPNKYITDDIDIHIYDLNDTGALNIAYDYQIEKYSEEEMNNIHSRMLNIIYQILENNNITINELEIVDNTEKNKLLNEFNNTQTHYDKTKTLSMLIEEQALKTPNRIALVFEDKEMTYSELNEKSNSLANYLRYKGVKPNDIIGIMVNRSLEMIISILAVLKAGGTYIPIDPEYPQDRIEYMLQNSNSKLLLTFSQLKDKVKFDNVEFVELINNNIYSTSSASLKCINNPDDSAYVIYTSGSTGKPKGVVLKHKALSNLTNYCNNYVEYLKDNKYRTIVSVTTVSFDIFIFETLISLTRGLKLVIANEDEQNIPRLLNKLIEKHNISIIQTTPARMQLFVNNYKYIPALKNLDFITLAGEPLSNALVNALKEISGATIYNGYGPSETTVFSTLTDVTNHKTITIGKPLDNTKIYILDKMFNLVPTGCVGELYIAGDGLGKGYLNRPDLTEKSFIPNPFIPGTLMYKTGDLGYFQDNGEIICLGRSDNQVKIRGLRIELEEIEHKILENKSITNCVVVKQTDETAHEFLCAYYTSNDEIDINNLRGDLSKNLPNYMVPQYFIKLNKLPYTPNGKVNRKLLSMSKIEKKAKTIVLPRNNTDSILIKILTELIGVKEISIKDSFFDLGGDSLTAINFCTYIYDKFSAQLSVKDIFDHPIIEDLSDLIASKSKISQKISITKAPIQSSYPVSYAQRGIYYANKIAGDNSVIYNMPGGLLLDKVPDINKLENSFNKLLQRHASLRTYFEIENEKLVQKIKDTSEFHIEINNTSINYSDIDECFYNFVKSFDLSKPPLIRAKLVYIDKSIDYKALLLLDIHHIICDGTSLQILVDDLCKLYNSEELPELKYNYLDFALSENNFLSSPDAQKAEKYWVSQFKNDIPVLEMPTSYKRPAVKSFEGNKLYFTLDSSSTKKIENICKNINITPYMFTLATYFILLYNYTSQDDIVIGSPITGRNYVEENNVVGMFVNTLPVRAHINVTSTFSDFLNLIKERCIANYEYQYYPFDKLVNVLNLKRNSSRNPLFDTIFTFQNTKSINPHLGDITSTVYSNSANVSKFDLSLEITPSDNGYIISFEYASKLFKDYFIRNLGNHYLNILKQLSENIDIIINDVVSVNEVNMLIHEYNNTQKNKINTANLLPRNSVDSDLINIFEDLTDLNNIKIKDSLFDLGGDSLTAINLCTRIYDKFKVQLSVKDIFEHHIIMELSDVISDKIKDLNNISIIKAPEQTSYPVSYAQQGIYFSSMVAGDNSVTYNIPCGLLLDKMPDAKRIEKCFQILIARHESLRTYFEFNKNSLVQKIKKSIKFNLDIEKNIIDICEIRQYYNNFIHPFDLSRSSSF